MANTNNEKIVWAFLKQKGLSDEAAAGVMGNIAVESGFNSSATNASSGAYGLFQWLGDRKTKLYSLARKNGKPASDITVQLNHFWDELKGSESKTLTALRKPGRTAAQYAADFERLFERSGGALLSKRTQKANEYYKKFSGTVAGGTVEDLPNTGDTSGGGDMDASFLQDLGKKIVTGMFVIVCIVLGAIFLLNAFDLKVVDNAKNTVKAVAKKGKKA